MTPFASVSKSLWATAIPSHSEIPTSSGLPGSGESSQAPSHWETSGPGHGVLLPELRKMYWDGVRRELLHILITLHEWQTRRCAATIVDEGDTSVHEFKSFLNQVTASSREFAVRSREMRSKLDKEQETGIKVFDSEHRQYQAHWRRLDKENTDLMAGITRNLQTQKKYDRVERTARMLLQCAGWLDMDKLIEHRPPLPSSYHIWNKLPTPQLELVGLDSHHLPILRPRRCSICTDVIRGSMFYQMGASGKNENAAYACHACFDESRLSNKYVKCYKHCVLADAITPEIAKTICRCRSVAGVDESGRRRRLFPMSKHDERAHRSTVGSGAVQCVLLNLGEMVAEAKYAGLVSKQGRRITLRDEERMTKDKIEKKRAKREKESGGKWPWSGLSGSSANSDTREKKIGDRVQIKEKEAHDEIPWFARPYANRFPFGKVHMALQFGPILIENGARQGALITSREAPTLQSYISDTGKNIEYSLSLDPNRMLRWQHRPRRRRRYKAVLKQVVGGAFSGAYSPELEHSIVQDLVQGSQFDIEGLDSESQTAILEDIVWRLHEKVQALIGSRVETYLSTIAERLLDARTPITWDYKTNNCQNFCDNLIDRRVFGPFLDSPVQSTSSCAPMSTRDHPLYLMSFICRPESYTTSEVRTKFDVPNGLTEAYLLKFRFGRHDESDLLDELSEYWYDWGAFGNHLYKYQDLFPWDCTEAYNNSGVCCGVCSLAKHVWAFPFDSWSIIQMHLRRDRQLYAGIMSDVDWMKNRLTVLHAHEALMSAAVAMIELKEFRLATRWLGVSSTAAESPQSDRVKLGGIHRAQPCCDNFHPGTYQDYFIARWAHLERPFQIKEYERLREIRRRVPDVGMEGWYANYVKHRKKNLDGLLKPPSRNMGPHTKAGGGSDMGGIGVGGHGESHDGGSGGMSQGPSHDFGSISQGGGHHDFGGISHGGHSHGGGHHDFGGSMDVGGGL